MMSSSTLIYAEPSPGTIAGISSIVGRLYLLASTVGYKYYLSKNLRKSGWKQIFAMVVLALWLGWLCHMPLFTSELHRETMGLETFQQMQFSQSTCQT
jgi:hypothetical protein